MEFEYIRHGTTSLIGFFDVATGRVELPYLNSTRTEEDFVEALAGTDSGHYAGDFYKRKTVLLTMLRT